MNMYILIQNFIIDQINEFVTTTGFKEVLIGVDGKAFLGDPVIPDNARSNEITGTFEDSQHARRSLTRERSNWVWQLKMSFHRKIELEGFIEQVVTPGLKIDRTDDNPAIFLNFTTFLVQHNVEIQGSANGTEVTWNIDAQVERRR